MSIAFIMHVSASVHSTLHVCISFQNCHFVRILIDVVASDVPIIIIIMISIDIRIITVNVMVCCILLYLKNSEV